MKYSKGPVASCSGRCILEAPAGDSCVAEHADDRVPADRVELSCAEMIEEKNRLEVLISDAAKARA